MLQTYSRRRGGSISYVPFLIGCGLLVLLVAFQMLRGLPELEATSTVQATSVLGEPRQLSLPAAGSSLLAVDGLGTLGANSPQVQRPLASVAKVMTAYVVLKDKPLAPGQSGSSIAITARDVARYGQMLANDESALPVSAGSQLTQLDLLQGMLVPSANNFSEILAAWDAGTVEAFVARMNTEAKALGMNSTTYVDTSGISPRTVSTVQDQLILAREIMKNPVFAQIVAMPEVRVPGVGLVDSTNEALGEDGVIGIKTGSTDEAGGNLLFAAARDVAGQKVTIFGAVFGQATRPAAFDATSRLLQATGPALQQAKVMSAGQSLGTVKAEWGGEVEVVAAEDVRLLLWPGMQLHAWIEFDAVEAPLARGEQVGWLNLELGEQKVRVPAVLAKGISKPGAIWRLTRI